MKTPPDLKPLSPSQLLELRRQLLAENQQLRHQNRDLRQEIERRKRRPSRLTPLAKKEPKTKPQTAGRKPAQGRFSYRRAPEPLSYGQPPIAVTVSQTQRPACGGLLQACAQEIVTHTDLPALPVPLVTAYAVEICRCQSCGKSLRAQHPQLPASQRRATARRLGSPALAAAHYLPDQLGIPVRKAPAVVKQLTGLEITRSALTQAALRSACGQGAVAQRYAELRAAVKEQAVIYTADTGWPEGGKVAYLMTFDSPAMTVYQIRERHRNEEVRQLIADHYDGVLTTDRGKSYDAKQLLMVKQQKGLRHIQRSVIEALDGSQGRERDFSLALKSQLKEAQEVKRQQLDGQLSGKVAERAGRDIEREINLHLRQRGLEDGKSERLRQQLLEHHERGKRLRFLHDSAVEATNNAAERDLRGAVIARKVSQGTKTARGSRAVEAFTSVLRTQMKQGSETVMERLCQLLERSPPSPAEANLPG